MRGYTAFLLGAAVSFTLIHPYGFAERLSEAATVARMTSSGDGLELEYVGEDGGMFKEMIPLYRVGAFRYFSTGTGLDERAAQYPPFPLKLIFVAGVKAYLSQVSVTIEDPKGALRLHVPGEQVTGPWLFVDLPDGTYKVTATRGDQTQVKDRLEVATGRVKTVYLRWKENTP